MSHPKSHVFYPKHILTFVIASVISGWALGDNTGSRFDPKQWPPGKTKIVEGVESIPKGTTVVVGPADPSKPGPINYIKMVNGTLYIEGSVTSELPAGDKVKTEIRMIDSAVGMNNKVINKGQLSSAREKTGNAADVIMALTKYGDTISNQGTVTVQGVKRQTAPIPSHIAFQAARKMNAAANEVNGTFNILSAPAIGFFIINGLGTNSGILNLSSQSSSDQPSYGMKASNENISKPGVDQGNAEIVNDGTINISGKNNYGMTATINTSNPPADNFFSSATNQGTIHVTGDGNVAMSTDTQQAKVNNSGHIFTQDNAVGIKISGNGQLVHEGSVSGTGTGLLYLGNFPNGVVIEPGYIVGGSTAIKMEQTGQTPLFVHGGTITGNIESVGGKDNTLYIAPPPKKDVSDKNTTVSIKGNISGFATVEIGGTDWLADGWIIDTSLINAVNASIDTISTQSPSASPESLYLSFSQPTSEDRQLTVHSLPESTIKTIDLSSKNYRPPLQLLMEGGETGTVKGRSDLNDTLVLNTGSVTTAVDTISTITVTSGSADAWSVAVPVMNPNYVNIEKGAQINSINASSSGSSGRGALNLAFNSDFTENGFVEVDNFGTLGSLDFSGDAQRPSLHFVQSGGDAGLLKTRPGMNDTLVMVSGTVKELSGFDNLIIRGDKWGSTKIDNPGTLSIARGGVVTRITDDMAAKKETGQLIVDFTRPSLNQSAFAINNEGGEIHGIDLSKPDSTRPQLFLNHLDGTTGNITGQPGNGDRLLLSGGKITESVSGIDDIWITGKQWETISIQNPSSITVTESGTASLVTTKDVASDKLTLPLKFTQSAVPVKNVSLNAHGTIAKMTFDDTGHRPPINMTQKVGTIGSIQSLVGKGDTLDVQNGTVGGDIIGLGSVTFSGPVAQFGGQRIETMTTVSISGKLILTSNQKVSATPVVHISKGGTLYAKVSSAAQPSGRDTALEVTGVYKQEGTLEVTLDEQTDPKAPYVKATEIEIGPEAVVLLNNQPNFSESAEYILMQSSDSDINAMPSLLTTSPSPYNTYSLRLAARQLFVVSYHHTATFVGDLARSGGANDSALKAINVAINRKTTDKLTTGPTRDSDPLNRWVLDQLKAVNHNPAEVAKIAGQMTPDLSGASISSAIASIRQSRAAIGARQSGLRTGIAAGDTVTSDHLWLQYANMDAVQDKKDGYFGYEAKTQGFTLGIDSDLNERLTLGVAYTYSKADVKGTHGSTSRIDAEGHTFSVYSNFKQGSLFVDGRIGYSWGENDGKRYVGKSEIEAKYDVNSWDIGLLTGCQRPLGQSGEWSWIPQLAFNYANIKPDDYREKRGTGWFDILGFDRVKNDSYEILELGAGLKLLGDIATASTTVKPEVSLMAYHDFKDDPVTMTAHFAQGGDAFLVNGAKREQNRYQFDAAVNLESHSNLTFTLSYHYDWMDSYKAHGFIARVSYGF
ncbi:autotransporter outer membrane beta-barrel domain-containing protein [Endozoicomonas sp. SESOKO3]|uniref:autotransporter outer membrane beta-barrel domain-containing protein n=2 Tax=unclassified Endozoicomonas TaxID=2644528 RepID=UPI0021478310|nr:autotransporter outer membrane beta-barrel domain-containing protein [Endozoicomonas sp. SESOKO3]